MKFLTLACFLFMSNCVFVKAQVFVCYSDDACGNNDGRMTGSGRNETDCCQHGVKPFGLSYTIEGIQGCNSCPIDFGFVNSSFTAKESIDTYQVKLSFFSGQSASGPFFLNINLEPITADPIDDIGLTFNRLFIPQVVESDELQIASAEILFRLDSTTQERNETFRLTFPPDPDFLPGAYLRNTSDGVIVDATRVTFELSEEDYQEREGNYGFMPVVIAKDHQVFLANPVTFLVIPWTVQQAIDEGLIPSKITVPGSPFFSPNRADANDFNISRIITEFEADEGHTAITHLDVPIPVFDDLVDEANHQYFITEFRVAAAVNMRLIRLEQQFSRCQIVDNDPLRIGFQLNQYNYLEPETGNRAEFNNVTLIKENNAESEQTFGLVITFGDPSTGINAAILQPADGQGAFDYVVGSPGDNTLLRLFPPENNEVTFTFSIFGDIFAEGTEGFRASLSSHGDPFPTFTLTETTDPAPYPETLIQIRDTDFAIVGFEQPSYTFNETDRNTPVCTILRNPPVGFNIILTLVTAEVTADISDFQEFTADRPGYSIFMKGSTTGRMCTSLLISQDNLFENIESFNVSLSLEDGVTGIIIDQPVTEVFILDAHHQTIGFIKTPYQASETDGFATIEFGILEGDTMPSVPVSVVLSFSDVSATGGSDYMEIDPQVFVFDSDTSTHTVMIPIINDDVFELAEIFQAKLGFEGGVAVSRVTLGPSFNITIVDDDNLVFGFDPDTYSDSEDVATQTLTVNLISGDAGALLFNLSAATDDSSTAATAIAGSDYVSGALSIRRIGQKSNEFSVNIINDELTERSEIFEAILTGVAVETNAGIQASLSPQEHGRIQFSPKRARVEILDDDEAIIGFSPVRYSSLESKGLVNSTFSVLQGTIAFDLKVLFTASSGSAVSDGDYEAASVEYTITGRGSVIAPVVLVDDSMGERTENFFGNLAFGGGEIFNNIMFAPNQSETTIIDDDVTIGFSHHSYEVTESSAFVKLIVCLLGGASLKTDVYIDFFLVSQTATDNGDYQDRIKSLVFNSVITNYTISVSIVNDATFELDEQFLATLKFASSTPQNVTISPKVAAITILDDDILVFCLESVRYDFVEGEEGQSLNLSLECGRVGEFTVTLTVTSDNTSDYANATVRSDYLPLLTSLPFSGTSTSGRIPVEIIADDVTEEVEFFDVHITGIELMNTSGVEQLMTDKDRERIILGQKHARVFIHDEDCPEPPIIFQLKGKYVARGSQVSIKTIGERNDALLCITPNESCCQRNRQARFEDHNGEKVPTNGENETLYRSKGTGVLRLNRRSGRDSSSAVGRYRCCLPDGCGEEKCIEINLV